MTGIGKARRIGKEFQNPAPISIGGLALALKIMPEWIFGKSARIPQRPLGPFHTNPNVYSAPPASGLRVTWIGHSTSLVEIDGIRILLDPVWDRHASPGTWYGPKRFFQAPLALRDLPPLDVILFSHDHYDHLGSRTVRALARLPAAAQARWVTMLNVTPVLREFRAPVDRITELDWTGSVRVGDIEITALPARHFSGRSFFNRNQTLWGSFVLAGPRHRVFYGADSGEWEGFADVGEKYGPFDLTMLEIGAYNAMWASIHMGPDGAARTHRLLNAKDHERKGLLMPIHWGLFDLALHRWDQPIERILKVAARDPELKLWLPEPGLPTEVVPGEGLHSEWWRR